METLNRKGNPGNKYYYPDCLSAMRKAAILLADDATQKKTIATLEAYMKEYVKATNMIAKALRGE